MQEVGVEEMSWELGVMRVGNQLQKQKKLIPGKVKKMSSMKEAIVHDVGEVE